MPQVWNYGQNAWAMQEVSLIEDLGDSEC